MRRFQPTALRSGTLSFAPGVTSRTISIPIVTDSIVELHETFFVNLSNATAGAVIVDNQGIGTISNDDQASLSIDNVDQVEGDSGITTFTFTVSTTNLASEDLTVVANTQGITATGGGTDFNDLVNQVVTIAAGNSSATVTVSSRLNGNSTKCLLMEY